MIYLIGGPPRVGKTTLASIALKEAQIASCSTDMLAMMLERGAPGLGVHHDFGARKTAALAPFLRPFLHCAQIVNADYLVEGDVITPAFVDSLRPQLKAVRSVFLGNTRLTEADLRLVPGWLGGREAGAYAQARRDIIAASKNLRDECAQTGHTYVEMGDGWNAGLRAAADVLQFTRIPVTA